MKCANYAFLIGMACCLQSLTAHAADEPLRATEAARRLLAGTASKEIRPEVVLEALAAVPVGQADWAECTFLAAELLGKLDAKKFAPQIRARYELLRSKGAGVWQVRGELGLFRLKAEQPGEREETAEQLDKLVGHWARDRSDAAIEGAFYLGLMYRELKKLPEARKSLEFARQRMRTRLAENSQEGYRGWLSIKEIESALSSVQERKPSVEPQEPLATMQRARREQAARKFPAAIGLFRSVSSSWPEHALAHEAGFRVCECLAQSGDTRAAGLELRKFVSAAPRGPWRGQAYLLSGDLLLLGEFKTAAAVTEYLHALTGPPEQPDRKPASSAVFSVETLKRAPAKADPVEASWAPALADVHNRLGILCFYYELYDQAAAHLERSAQLRPESTFGGTGGMACLADFARRREDPIPREYLKQGDERSRFVLFFASALAAGWDGAGALSLYERVFRNEFENATVEQRAYARFGMGEGYTHLGLDEREKAKGVYGEFLKPPLSQSMIAPRAILALAVTHSADAEKEKCREYLERIVKDYPRSEWRAWAMMQRAYWSYAHEAPAKGIAWYQRFLKEYPKHDWAEDARWFHEQLEVELKTGKQRS